MKAFKVQRNGEEYFRVELPRDFSPDGRRQSVVVRTRRDALEKAQKLLDGRKKGLKVNESRSSLAEFLREFLEFYESEGGVSLRTWQDYRYYIETNIIPGLGTAALYELKPRHVDFWMKSLRNRGLGG